MKKYLFLFLMFTSSASMVFAQKGNDRGDKVQALKIAFLTQKLQLTSDEAEKFWPVYNQYENELAKIRAKNKDGDVLESEQQLLDTRKKYRASFEKVLGPDKLNALYNAEKDFRNVLIKRLKNHGSPGGKR